MSARYGLPLVPPRVDSDGRVYTREYTWQETHCGRQGPPWLTATLACASRGIGCGCSDRERLGLATERFMHAPGDDLVPPDEALKVIRPYLPHIKTAAQLFVASAWQPFKSVFEKGHVYYQNQVIVVWAKARAAGRLAPWEIVDKARPRPRTRPRRLAKAA